MNITALALILPFLLLAGCSSSQLKYTPAAGEGTPGYMDSQISTDRYRVTYTGTRSSSDDRVKDYALLRAAELTLLNGHDWFRVVSSDNTQTSLERPAPITTTTHTRIERDCGLLGCTTTATPVYTGVTGSTIRSGNRLTSSLEIVMGSGDAADPTAVYDAKELRLYLTDKHKPGT